MLAMTKIAILSSLAVVAVVATIAVAGMNKPEQTEIGGLFPPADPLNKVIIPGPDRNASEASAIVGYKVSAPTYLPQGYSIKAFRADPVGKDVVILAWDKHITDQTTDMEFLYKGKGMIIFITKNPPDYNMTKVIDMWLEQQAEFGAHKVTINGLPGIAQDRQTITDDTGELVPILAEVTFWKEDLTSINIRGDLPETELIKVAESMKFS